MHPSPYVGLAPYQEADEVLFFGRAEEIRALTLRVLTDPVTVVYGGSGVGKSSVLNAGLLPALRRQGATVVTQSHWQNPRAGLQELLRSLLPDTAAPGTPRDTLRRAANQLEGDLVVVLDQFEELFAQSVPSQEDLVEIGELLGASVPGAHLIVSLRDDFYSRLDVFRRQAPGLLSNPWRLKKLSAEQAREAIAGPARASGTEIEAMLPDVVIHELVENTAHNAPVEVEAAFLQIVMTSLWEAEVARGSKLLRVSTLEELGGARRLAATYLDRKLARLTVAEQDACAYAFRFLVSSNSTKIAQTLEDVAEFAGVDRNTLRSALEQLSEGRILRRFQAADGRTLFEIYHDLLSAPIQEWRTRYLQQRDVKQARETALAENYRRLAWLAAALGVLLLVVLVLGVNYYGLAHSQAELAKARKQDLDKLASAQKEKDRLEVDRDFAQAKQAEAERATALAQRQKLQDRNRALEKEKRDLQAVVSAQQAAQTESDKRKALELRTQARDLPAAQNDLAIWLFMHSLRLAPADAAVNELAELLARPTFLDGYATPYRGFANPAISRDGKVVAIPRDGKIWFWDVDSRRVARKLPASPSAYAVQFNTDASRIAVADAAGVRILDSSSGHVQATIPCARGPYNAGFRLDSQFRYLQCGSYSASLTYVPSGKQVPLAAAPLGFSPDGSLMLTGEPAALVISTLNPSAEPGSFTTGEIRAPVSGLVAAAVDPGNREVVVLKRDLGSADVSLVFGTIRGDQVSLDQPLRIQNCSPESVSIDETAIVNCLGGQDTQLIGWPSGKQPFHIGQAGTCQSGASSGELLCHTTVSFTRRNIYGEVLASLPRSGGDLLGALLRPTGDRAVTRERDGRVTVIDTRTGEDLWFASVPIGNVWGLSSGGDGKGFFVRTDRGLLTADWDGNGSLREVKDSQHGAAVGFDSRLLASMDGLSIRVRSLDSTSGRTFPANPGELDVNLVNRDRALAAIGAAAPGQVVDLASGRMLYPLPPASSIVASSTGETFAVKLSPSGNSTEIRVFHASDGAVRGDFMMGAFGNVLALNDQGTLLVSAEQGGTPGSSVVAVYDVAAGQRKLTFPCTTYWNGVDAVLSADSKELTVFDRGTVVRYPVLGREELIAEAQRRVGSKFGDAECRKYLERPCSARQ
ncbi:MAG TPA: hypothetical protein VMH28_11405 [Candidatus Acidoferrales bacterium]|nr:hypothetical protein [Candidatus Acidoferrales bacterium]